MRTETGGASANDGVFIGALDTATSCVSGDCGDTRALLLPSEATSLQQRTGCSQAEVRDRQGSGITPAMEYY